MGDTYTRPGTRPCSECGTPMDCTRERGRPRVTCSGACKQARSRRRSKANTRDRLRELEALVRDQGDPEVERAYVDLIRTVPGFRDTLDLTLRRSLDGGRDARRSR